MDYPRISRYKIHDNPGSRTRSFPMIGGSTWSGCWIPSRIIASEIWDDFFFWVWDYCGINLDFFLFHFWLGWSAGMRNAPMSAHLTLVWQPFLIPLLRRLKWQWPRSALTATWRWAPQLLSRSRRLRCQENNFRQRQTITISPSNHFRCYEFLGT